MQFFHSITSVFFHRISSNIAYKLLSGISIIGLLKDKFHPFLMELLSLIIIVKSFWPVFPLLLMIYDWNFTDMFNIKGYIF